MDSRLIALAIPSAAVLAGLVWHSLSAMPRQRAALFWISVLTYGVLRGLGVRFVTEAIGASFPYEIQNPMLSFAGVSAQEIVGWAVVAYLAWWIGWRFSLRAARPFLFLQVAWASLFLGGISWAIEAAAIAARWWHWTVPTASRVFLNVPAIGIVDWFFVGIDFLLPFAAITAPTLAHTRWRYMTLLLFPAHFAGHLLPGIWLHVVHWLLVLIVVWWALRSTAEDEPFGRARDWIPSTGFAVIAADIALVDLFLVSRPELLQSIAPVLILWLASIRPAIATGLAVTSLLVAFALPSMLVASAVGAGSAVLLWFRERRRALAAIVLIALFAIGFHRGTAASRADMTRRLDDAIAARDRGDLEGAVSELDAIARDHPTTHVPLALSAEIDYRTNRLDSAHGKLARAVEIKQDFIRGYRLLAAIDLQRGRRVDAREWASRGLEIAPNDLQLRYLAGHDITSEIDSPESAAGIAALAFEVADITTARDIVEHSLARWPDDPRLGQVAAHLSTR